MTGKESILGKMRLFVGGAAALGLLALLGSLSPAAGEAPSGEPTVRPSAHALARVAVVRQPGLHTYEELIDELRSSVRAAVRVAATQPEQAEDLQAWLRRYRPAVVVAVGQSAFDQVRGLPMPVVSVLALARPAERGAVSIQVPLVTALIAFDTARPGIRRLGVLHGRATAAQMAGAQAEARLLGVDLVLEEVSSPTAAIARLRQLATQVEGLWLVPDLEALSPQVLHYAVMQQFRRRIPLLGPTRRHTMQGALFSLDHDPADLGRQAATLTNQLLAGERPLPAPPLAAKLSLNFTTAQRIGVDSPDLRRLADRVYQ